MTHTRDADVYFSKIAAEASPQGKSKWLGDLTDCDRCGTPFSNAPWMIDGVDPDSEGESWGCYCAKCALSQQLRIGWGYGQLYQRQGADWVLVAGGDSSHISGDSEDL